MGTKMDKNGRDPAEAEDIKARWKEYIEELYKLDLNEPNYYSGLVSYPEPDILELKGKWALRNCF